MPNHTPSQVKRAIRCSLAAILDPELTNSERKRVAEFFAYACAFCGVALPASSRAHMDHLISIAVGGTNHISNRVLACPVCNGDQKLERDWREFLRYKTGGGKVFEERETRILDWREQNSNSSRALSPAQKILLRDQTERVVAACESAIEALRQARRKS